MNSAKLPCPCPACQGKLVSAYIRHLHMKIFVSGRRQSGVASQPSLGLDSCSAVQDDSVQDDSDNDPQFSGSYCPHQVQDSIDEVHSDHEATPEESSTETLSGLYDIHAYDNEDLSAPLYSGAKITVMDAIVKHLAWFSGHPGLSKEAFSDILKMQHYEILPSGNLLPPSYSDAMKLVEPFLIQPILFHVCPNDCLVFRGDYISLDACTVCGARRYDDAGNPAKRFSYLPVGPRLVRLFGTPNLAKIVQAHGLRNSSEYLYDIHDSSAWKMAYSSSGEYAAECRSISFALNTDGVNPYSQNRVSYSMWPIILTVLNLPRNVRYDFGNFWLVGTVPGNGTKEPGTLDPYLSILVDELLSITNKEVFDAYACAPFKMKVDILLYILDYPGIGKVFNVMGANAYQACAWCEIQGTYSSELHKMMYLHNRNFLSMSNSELRCDILRYPDKTKDLAIAPKYRVYENVEQLHRAYDASKTQKVAKAVAKSTGCKGSYCFMRLPNHNRLLQCYPDAMHTIKDVVEHIFFLLIGKSNLHKIGVTEAANGRFGFKISSHGIQKFEHPYVLPKAELKLADLRSKTITMPKGDFHPGCTFFRTTSLKSHDWKELIAKNILKFCLRGMLQDLQRSTLFQFCDVIRAVLSESIHQPSLQQIETDLNVALALMERDFPTDLQVITMHLLRHIVDGMKAFGPVYGTWMYAYERFNSWLHRRVLNRRFPEATLMETYRIFEWCNYMKMSGKLTISDYGILSDCHGVAEEVGTDIVQLLVSAYRKLIPRFDELIVDYNCQERMERKKRKMFPPLCKWVPKEMCEGDIELLKGPSNLITVYKKLNVEHSNTGRLVTYAPAKINSKCAQCYVQVVSAEHRPVFGKIKQCFVHRFAESFSFVLMDIYSNESLQQDVDSKLWFVPLNHEQEIFSEQAIHEITRNCLLSSPLVTAQDEGKLWFLNSF